MKSGMARYTRKTCTYVAFRVFLCNNVRVYPSDDRHDLFAIDAARGTYLGSTSNIPSVLQALAVYCRQSGLHPCENFIHGGKVVCQYEVVELHVPRFRVSEPEIPSPSQRSSAML